MNEEIQSKFKIESDRGWALIEPTSVCLRQSPPRSAKKLPRSEVRARRKIKLKMRKKSKK